MEGGVHLLALDAWQIEGEKAIVGHGGRGASVVRRGRRSENELLPDGDGLRYTRHPANSDPQQTIRASPTFREAIRRMLNLQTFFLWTTLLSLVLVSAVPLSSTATASDKFVCSPQRAIDVEFSKCPHDVRWFPTLSEVSDMLTKHKRWLDGSATSKEAGAARAIFCNAVLRGVDFSNSNLNYANFEGADLSHGTFLIERTNFSNAKLRCVNFRAANLAFATFKNADLFGAVFDYSDLSWTTLKYANLWNSSLREARLTHANLQNAKYLPVSQPSKNYLSGIIGLDRLELSTTSGKVDPTAATQLRELFREVGLRQSEREVTFSIEHGPAFAILNSCPPTSWVVDDPKGVRQLPCSPWSSLDAVVRFLFFEVTTKWGLSPGRALLILGFLIVMMTPIYAFAILAARGSRAHTGIFRIWSEKRIISEEGKFSVATEEKVERIEASIGLALVWGLYFSASSAFYLGWRDVNVGTWIARMQFREYTLRALGWVRLLSGVQSIISIYLVVIWALTYFGRPFQ